MAAVRGLWSTMPELDGFTVVVEGIEKVAL